MPPRFCSQCGASFHETDPHEAETAAGTQPMVPGFESGVGDRVGPYRLIRELGRGGMGVVYEAEQQETGRIVALKLLPRGTRRTEETIQRFLREGQVAASLSHPRSTFIYAAGEDSGQFYIAMELMPQGTVREVVDREGALPTQRAVDYILDVMEGLSAAHAVGVVHRDVKPSNCFLDHQGRVKVGDYGISKLLLGDAALTRTGAFVGTPQFAAPEQIRSAAIDHRTDVYAVGATLFYLLTARAPFDGDAISVVADIASQPAPLIRTLRPQVPRGLERAIARCLEKSPDARPQNLDQLRLALAPYSSRGGSLANLGRRLAAYLIDLLVVAFTFPFVAVLMLAAWFLLSRGAFDVTVVGRAIVVVSGVFGVLYFSIAEGHWGCGLGKRILGLRVVDSAGEPPGVFRGLGRSFLIPGVVQFCAQMMSFVVVSPMTTMDTTPSERVFTVMYSQSGNFVSWMLTLVLLSTMRKANGYRGIHEWISGTQVVRQQAPSSAGERQTVPVTLPRAIDQPRRVGDYELAGLFGESDGVSLYAAFDHTLERPVWIYCGPPDRRELPAQRLSVARPSRSHWLDWGSTPEETWDATEAVKGSPCWDLARRRRGIPWREGRAVLYELGEELLAAAGDGTLPRQLSLSQVWLDKSSRLKLVEIPLATAGHERPAAMIEGEDHERAADLLVAAARDIARNQALPGHAQDFFADLEGLPRNRTGLQWAVGQLQSMLDRPSAIKWDDRLGHLAISFSLETAVYYFAVSMLSLSLSLIPGMTTPLNFTLTLVPVLLMPFLLGVFFKGSAVFTFAGVEVRDKGGRPAGRLRCGLRSVVAWLPAVTANCLFMMYSVKFILANPYDVEVLGSINETITWTLLLAAGGLLMLLHLGCGAYCLLRPNRGLQDVIAGTRIVPK